MAQKCILALALLGSAVADHLRTRHEYEALFFEHVQKYDLKMASGEEFANRLEIFANKDDEITVHNAAYAAGNFTWWMGHNEYSHLAWDEFQAMFHLGQAMDPVLLKRAHGKVFTEADAAGVPGALHKDWEALGKVTPVKNQGSCGSCWAFSTTGSLEGAYGIANDLNISAWAGFSEQMLVSCDTTDSGCNGGLMDDAFEWINGYGGICSEEAYPYTSGGGATAACADSSCNVLPGSNPPSYTDVEPGSSAALEAAITLQPVSVAIQANQAAFQSYSGGVLTARCGDRLDHGVLAVGYGTWTDNETKYWKVKNSWGASWGMDGYILMEKGSTVNECGILDAASYPTLNKI